jgi:SAM-dependent methyltransferase
MQLGLREEFEYIKCSSCGCIQIMDIPMDLSRYYPNHYYSLGQVANPPSADFRISLRRQRTKYWLAGESLTGRLLSRRRQMPAWFQWSQHTGVRTDSAILDVGSGTGDLLSTMAKEGFSNLLGVDPFINDSITYASGARVIKGDMSSVGGPFDLIMLHHSFEHMPNPLEAMIHIHRLLKPDRYALIRTPVASSFAWEKYGVHWFQLDAPRHLYVHTPSSIRLLAEEPGLVLEDVVYDSNALQFTASEQYELNVPLREQEDLRSYSPEALEDLEIRAARLNLEGRGDQATFYLYKRRAARF